MFSFRNSMPSSANVFFKKRYLYRRPPPPQKKKIIEISKVWKGLNISVRVTSHTKMKTDPDR